MEILGKSPIPVLFLIIGKVAMFCCWLFFLVKSWYPESMLFDNEATRAIGVILFAGGLGLVILALSELGRSASVGIPRGKTTLKTLGLYQFSRNPIYVGAFMMCAGSCLFSLHPVNLVLFGITMAVHHWIITREEEFLETTFGQEWLNYKRRVPRYLGRIRTSNVRLT